MLILAAKAGNLPLLIPFVKATLRDKMVGYSVSSLPNLLSLICPFSNLAKPNHAPNTHQKKEASVPENCLMGSNLPSFMILRSYPLTMSPIDQCFQSPNKICWNGWCSNGKPYVTALDRSPEFVLSSNMKFYVFFFSYFIQSMLFLVATFVDFPLQ